MDFRQPLGVITPSLDGDVLTALAQADAWFTPGRLHRALGRRSEDGIRRVLVRLAEQGVVSTLNGGNATLYRLNRLHLAADAIVSLVNLRWELMRRMAEEIGGWDPHPVYAALFGSVARGEATAQSNIDIFIVRSDWIEDEETWNGAVMRLEANVSIWTGNDSRVLQMIESHVREHAVEEPVLADIVAHGIPLFGDGEWLGQQLSQSDHG